MYKIVKNITAASMLIAAGTTAAWASGTHDGGHNVTIGEVGLSENVTRTIEIIMYDNYYEPENISVKEGETIRFLIKNVGEFVHEFNIGSAAMHGAHQEEMMMMMDHGILEVDKINHEMMSMDMGNGQTMEHNDPNSVLLEPGKNDEIIWKFTKNSEIEFACNVPGHYESGMVGNIKF